VKVHTDSSIVDEILSLKKEKNAVILAHNYQIPEVQRFSELKVGDKVTVRYYESVVYQIQKPGAAPVPAGEQAGIVRGEGPKPGGTISRQMTATVTVTAIDMKVPSVTIRTDDGSVFRPDQPGLQPGRVLSGPLDLPRHHAGRRRDRR
jgi:hypothetical protein